MSLSPVIGMEVPEAANGVLTSPGAPGCAGSRVNGESHAPPDQAGRPTTQTVPSEDREANVAKPTHTKEPFPPDPQCIWERPRVAAQRSDATGGVSPPPEGAAATDTRWAEGGGGEREKQDEEEDEKEEREWRRRRPQRSAGGGADGEPPHHYSSSAPGPSTTTTSSSSCGASPSLPCTGDSSCPPHVMAQVRVRNVPERERIVRGMQDSKSLDEISQACGGGPGRGGQAEGRRATISSALELEGTVSHDGDLTHFITRNLEHKIKMSSKLSVDGCSDSECSGPILRSRGLSRRPADIPPIDPAVLLDLQKHTQEVAHSVKLMMKSLNGTIQNMTALSVGYIQTYRDSVDSLGESVDMSIKGLYTLMARCEELDRSMQPIHTLAAQIHDIKRTLDTLEAVCK